MPNVIHLLTKYIGRQIIYMYYIIGIFTSICDFLYLSMENMLKCNDVGGSLKNEPGLEGDLKKWTILTMATRGHIYVAIMI